MKKYILKIYNNPLFSGSVIMIFGNMFANAVNYLYHILMGRMLGPVNYGVLASIYSILYLVSIIPASTSVAIVKFVSVTRSESETYSVYKSISGYVFKFALVVSLLIFIFTPLISMFLNITDYWSVSLVAPVLFFSLITLVNQSTSQGLTRFMGNVGPNVISSLVKLLLGISLVYIGWSVFGAMVGVVVALVSAYYYSQIFLSKYIKVHKVQIIDLKPFFTYALPVLIQALAFTSIFTTDVILVKHFLPALDAGMYAALSTLGKIIFFASSPIAATMFPIVSKNHTNGNSYKNTFLLSFSATIIASIVIVLFYWLYPSIAIGILYGKAYLSASSNLIWMGLFLLFYSLSSYLVNFFLAIGRVNVVVFPLILAVVQIVLIWFRHGSILDVLQISFGISLVLFILLGGYLIVHVFSDRKIIK